MKKYLMVALIAATSSITNIYGADLSNSIEYSQLYIVGEATPKGWDLGNADEMDKISYGVFEWTGELKADKDFKFMNCNYGWNKHIVATKPGLCIECGVTYPLNFFASWSLSDDKDLKMHVGETARYTIVVDLNSMLVTLSPAASQPEWPKQFHITGSAVNGSTIAIADFYGVEMKAAVELQCGDVKLIDTPNVTDATTYFLPRFADVDIAFGNGYTNRFVTSKDASTPGWSVLVPGKYNLYLNTASHTYNFSRFTQYKALYIVGGCCERRWNYWDESNCVFYPDPLRPEVMVWEGELRIGWEPYEDGTPAEEPNRFKILTEKSWFAPTFHPYVADASAVGTTDARISGGDDLKWTIDKDGFYRLELNTFTGVLTGTYIGESMAPDGTTAHPAGIDNATYSHTNDTAYYYNLQGVRIDNPVNGIFIEVAGGKASKVIR